MNFPYKAALFDWAYTLVDLVEEDDRKALKGVVEFLRSKGFELSKFDEIYADYRDLFYKMIAHSRESHLEAHFEHVLNFILIQHRINLKDKTTVDELLKIYYEEIYSHRKVYPEVVPTLKSLQSAGVRMGIVSNTTNPGFMKDYERAVMGLDPYFEFSIYSSEVPFRKPHPSIFQLALRRLQLQPEEVLFIGDNLNADIAGARGVGLPTAWINRKMDPAPVKNPPDYSLRRLDELLTIQ